MTERKARLKNFPGALRGLALTRVDVVTYSRLYGKSDAQAARELISIGFPGDEIKERMTIKIDSWNYRRMKRSAAAALVFKDFLGEPNSQVTRGIS